jgi:hypothetical protein
MKTTLAESRSGIAAVTNFAPPGSMTTRWEEAMGAPV